MIPRVVYLSAPPYSDLALELLRTCPCDIVVGLTQDQKLDWKGWERQPLNWYDLGINFLGTHKIPANEVNRPRLGWVNFHPAPLPEYRGRNLAYHAILDGAEKFGATVHYMDEGYDTGDIIEVLKFPIEDWMTAGWIMAEARQLCFELFASWIRRLLQGRVPATPQPKDGRYYRKEAIGDEVSIDGQQGCLIRALTVHPKHHARLVIGGKKYKIVPEDGQ